MSVDFGHIMLFYILRFEGVKGHLMFVILKEGMRDKSRKRE